MPVGTAPKECSEKVYLHHKSVQVRFLMRSCVFGAGVFEVAQVSIAYGRRHSRKPGQKTG